MNVKQGRLAKHLETMSNDYLFDGRYLYKRWRNRKLQKATLLMTSEAPLGLQVYYLTEKKKVCLSQRQSYSCRSRLSVQKSIKPCVLFYALGSQLLAISQLHYTRELRAQQCPVSDRECPSNRYFSSFRLKTYRIRARNGSGNKYSKSNLR